IERNRALPRLDYSRANGVSTIRPVTSAGKFLRTAQSQVDSISPAASYGGTKNRLTHPGQGAGKLLPLLWLFRCGSREATAASVPVTPLPLPSEHMSDRRRSRQAEADRASRQATPGGVRFLWSASCTVAEIV